MSPVDETSLIHARVAVLEDWREEHREWMAEVRSKLDNIANTVMSLRLCATPNACVGLGKSLDAAQDEIDANAATLAAALKRVESLERSRVFLTGAAATAGIVWAVAQVVLPLVIGCKGP